MLFRSQDSSGEVTHQLMKFEPVPGISEELFLNQMCLVSNGGHNLLEPAALAKPVLSGPHLFNFLEIAAMLREAGALQEVDDAEGLAVAVQRLFELPRDAQKMADAGLKVMAANQGALQRLLDGLDRLLNPR